MSKRFSNIINMYLLFALLLFSAVILVLQIDALNDKYHIVYNNGRTEELPSHYIYKLGVKNNIFESSFQVAYRFQYICIIISSLGVFVSVILIIVIISFSNKDKIIKLSWQWLLVGISFVALTLFSFIYPLCFKDIIPFKAYLGAA